MITAVFDCGVVAAGIGWQGNPRYCLDLVMTPIGFLKLARSRTEF